MHFMKYTANHCHYKAWKITIIHLRAYLLDLHTRVKGHGEENHDVVN